MGGRIVLDAESFKALSSETRIQLLRHLNKSQLTLTDLAKRMDLAKATVSSHLESLEGAGLIRRKDEGRKWIYYSLTRKGKAVLNPESEKVRVILVLSTVLLVGGLVSLLIWVVTSAHHDWAGLSQGTFESTATSLLLGIGALVASVSLYMAVLLLRRIARRIEPRSLSHQYR